MRIATECPALVGEARAAFETRVKVDFALRAPEGGVLSVQCDASTAHLAWRPTQPGAKAADASVSIPVQGLVDLLLEAASGLLLESAAVAPSSSASPTDSATEPDGGTSPPVVSGGATRSRGRAAARTSGVVPLETDGSDEPIDPDDGDFARSTRRWLGAGVAIGGTARYLGGDAPAVAGASGSIALYGPSIGRLMLTATGGAAWGVGRVDGVIGVSLWEIGIGADLLLGAKHNWVVGLFGTGGVFTANADPTISPDTNTSTFGSVALHAGYVVSGLPVRFIVAPELRLMLPPISVRLGTPELFSAGGVGAGITLVGLLPIIGPGEGP